MTAIVTRVESVEPYGETLSIVTTAEGNKVIANKDSNGNFRWTPNDRIAYVSEGSIIPEDVLKERGYWDNEKDRGLLDGGKRNRVKMKKLAGFEIHFEPTVAAASGPSCRRLLQTPHQNQSAQLFAGLAVR